MYESSVGLDMLERSSAANRINLLLREVGLHLLSLEHARRPQKVMVHWVYGFVAA